MGWLLVLVGSSHRPLAWNRPQLIQFLLPGLLQKVPDSLGQKSGGRVSNCCVSECTLQSVHSISALLPILLFQPSIHAVMNALQAHSPREPPALPFLPWLPKGAFRSESPEQSWDGGLRRSLLPPVPSSPHQLVPKAALCWGNSAMCFFKYIQPCAGLQTRP